MLPSCMRPWKWAYLMFFLSCRPSFGHILEALDHVDPHLVSLDKEKSGKVSKPAVRYHDHKFCFYHYIYLERIILIFFWVALSLTILFPFCQWIVSISKFDKSKCLWRTLKTGARWEERNSSGAAKMDYEQTVKQAKYVINYIYFNLCSFWFNVSTHAQLEF